MKKELNKLVRPNITLLCKSFFNQQFTTNLSRLLKTKKYYHRIDIARKM